MMSGARNGVSEGETTITCLSPLTVVIEVCLVSEVHVAMRTPVVFVQCQLLEVLVEVHEEHFRIVNFGRLSAQSARYRIMVITIAFGTLVM